MAGEGVRGVQPRLASLLLGLQGKLYRLGERRSTCKPMAIQVLGTMTRTVVEGGWCLFTHTHSCTPVHTHTEPAPQAQRQHICHLHGTDKEIAASLWEGHGSGPVVVSGLTRGLAQEPVSLNPGPSCP